jgi:hypothetical protein
VGKNIHQCRLVELVRYEQRQRRKTKQGVEASFLISISKNAFSTTATFATPLRLTPASTCIQESSTANDQRQ